MGEVKFNITSFDDAIANGKTNVIDETLQLMESDLEEGNVLILEKFQLNEITESHIIKNMAEFQQFKNRLL